MTLYGRQIEDLTDTLYPKAYLTERIVCAKRFIEEHYAENINIDIISGEACISKYHFIRLFKKYYGQTPHQYLSEVRVKKAEKLIRGGMTVRGACFAVGYSSVTSFSALFKKMTGSAPSRIN